jgi:N-acetylneuraminic acid mutarotase
LIFFGTHPALTTISRSKVYDIATNKWVTFNDLPGPYNASDCTGYAYNNHAYFVAGYNLTYGFKNTHFAIDTVKSLANHSLVIVDKAPIQLGRGDTASEINIEGTAAVVVGGFGASNTFCQAMSEVEIYDFAADSWSFTAPLITSVADVALANVDDHILTLGGERQIDNICNIANPDPGQKTIAVNNVEDLDLHPSSGAPQWVRIADFPEHRFRFAAVAYDDNVVYTFGGQNAYQLSCKCLSTSNEVVVYVQSNVTGNVSNVPGGAGFGTGKVGSGAAIATSLFAGSVTIVAAALIM